MAGNWTESRAPLSSFLNLTELLGQTQVNAAPDGTLILPFQLGACGPARHWVEVEPFVWHDLNSHEVLAAQVENGVPVRFSVNTVSPFMVTTRPPTSAIFRSRTRRGSPTHARQSSTIPRWPRGTRPAAISSR